MYKTYIAIIYSNLIIMPCQYVITTEIQCSSKHTEETDGNLGQTKQYDSRR